MTRKATAYVAEIMLGRTGEVIGCAAQKESILRYAAENDIEIVAWYEDDVYTEDLFERPGLKAMCEARLGCNCLLVDRIWALSRNWKQIRAFLDKAKCEDVVVQATTTMWDCLSQMARQYYKPPRKVVATPVVEETAPARVHRPAELTFGDLRRAPRPA